jgi:hypothetical protein
MLPQCAKAKSTAGVSVRSWRLSVIDSGYF